MLPPSGGQGDRDFGPGSDDDDDSEDLEMGQTQNPHRDSEAILFLRTPDNPNDDDRDSVPRPALNGKTRARRILSFLSGGALPWLVNLILVLALLIDRRDAAAKTCSHDAPPVLTPTLAEEYVEYRTEVMYDGVDKRNPASPYQGWPTPEKDALWDRFDGAMFRVSAQEAAALPHRTLQVALPESLPRDEYLVGATFTHALHCLNQLRRATYPRHYNESLVDAATGRVDYFKWWHLDHCVEVLRRYVTCHADTTPYTFDWVEGARIAVHPGTVHTCRNFDRVMDVSVFFGFFFVLPNQKPQKIIAGFLVC